MSKDIDVMSTKRPRLFYALFAPYEPILLANGADNFINDKGNHECVEFVRQATGAPSTPCWRPGDRVRGNVSLPAGIAIATFKGDSYHGKHAAIYLGQNSEGLVVIDQWNKQAAVKKRTIYFPEVKTPTKASNDADLYFVIDPVKTGEVAGGKKEPVKARIVSG